jgi:hypothetical protein
MLIPDRRGSSTSMGAPLGEGPCSVMRSPYPTRPETQLGQPAVAGLRADHRVDPRRLLSERGSGVSRDRHFCARKRRSRPFGGVDADGTVAVRSRRTAGRRKRRLAATRRQASKQAGRQVGGQASRQASRQAGRQAGRRAVRTASLQARRPSGRQTAANTHYPRTTPVLPRTSSRGRYATSASGASPSRSAWSRRQACSPSSASGTEAVVSGGVV